MMEMRYGTKTTPIAKRKATCLTPTEKTSKIRKVEPSPLMKATSAKSRLLKAKAKKTVGFS